MRGRGFTPRKWEGLHAPKEGGALRPECGRGFMPRMWEGLYAPNVGGALRPESGRGFMPRLSRGKPAPTGANRGINPLPRERIAGVTPSPTVGNSYPSKNPSPNGVTSRPADSAAARAAHAGGRGPPPAEKAAPPPPPSFPRCSCLETQTSGAPSAP